MAPWRIALGAIGCLLIGGCARDYLVGETDPMGDGADSSSGTSAGVEGDGGETSGTKGTDGGEGSGDDKDATDSKDADDKGTGDVEDDAVTALYLAGGLDRIRVFHRVPVDGYCTVTTIVRPGADGGDGVLKLPAQWGLEDAVLTTDVVDCDSSAKMGAANSVSGAINAIDDAPDGIPCKLGIDLQLKFGGDASIGADEVVASDVPVVGCP